MGLLKHSLNKYRQLYLHGVELTLAGWWGGLINVYVDNSRGWEQLHFVYTLVPKLTHDIG